MAVAPASPSNPPTPPTAEIQKTPISDSAKRNPSPLRCSSSSKRVRCAKDQVFDDGVGESETKRSCHQCRQKSSFLVASCKNQRGSKCCVLNYCRKCLLNRYGEKAEEVDLLSDWKCPKCRDLCNCSVCLKKKGKEPTGILVRAAKATGFSSVSDMLIGKENDTLTSTTPLKDADSSSMKLDSSRKKSVVSPRKSGNSNFSDGKNDSSLKLRESVVASPGKDGKENIFAGRVDPNFDGSLSKLSGIKKTIGICKRKNIGKKDVSSKSPGLAKDESEMKNTSKKFKILNDNEANNIRSEEVKIEKKDLGVVAKAKNLKKSQKINQKLPNHINEKEKKSTSKNDPQKAMPKVVSQVGTKNEGANIEKKDPGVAAEARNLKKSQDVVQTSPNITNEKEKKTVGKNDSQKAMSKVVSQVCSKNEDVKNPVGSDDRKKIPDNRDSNNHQLDSDTNRNFIKVDDANIEKKDSVMPKAKAPKKSLIIDGTKLIPNNKGEKISKTSSTLSEQATPKKNSEKMSQDRIEDKTVEESMSVLVGDKTDIATGNNDDIQSFNVTPNICESNTMKVQYGGFAVDTLLPQGIALTNVAGVDLPAEDVGPALQFLEFCRVFGKFFHLMKGQPESILRELIRGCTRRTRTQHSSVAQFHIQLLSLLLQDSGERSVTLSQTSSGNSWLAAFEKCISESECSFDGLPSNCFNKDGSGYNMLSSAQKLRLLNFLCDEALCTADLRTWIDEQNSIFFDEEKEAKQKVTIAKNKEKQVKQQIQDEMDRFINSDEPLSISKHDDLVSKLKTEADKAHAEYLEAIKKIPNYKQRSDALRTEPVLFDGKGHVFWRLKSCNAQQDILVQEIGNLDTVSGEEKWFTYDVEQKGMVEKYISTRGKRVRLQRVPNVLVPDTNQA